MKTAWQAQIEREAKQWGADAFTYEDGASEAAFLEYASRNACTYSTGELHNDYEFAPAYAAFVAGYELAQAESVNFDWEAA